MKTYIVRGFLAIIPLVLSILVIQILYNNIDRRVVALLDRTIGFSFPGLGIILSLAALYLLGFIASNIVGKNRCYKYSYQSYHILLKPFS